MMRKANPHADYLERLLADEVLTIDEKIDLLKRCAEDLRSMEVAQGEGMAGEFSDMLDRVLMALERLMCERQDKEAAQE